jgi:hypothetical protein
MRRPEIEDLSFEDAVSELEKITRWLETHEEVQPPDRARCCAMAEGYGP